MSMTNEAIREAREGSRTSGAGAPVYEDGQLHKGAESSAQGRTIAVASTFTVDLLQAPLQFWMQQLGMNTNVELCPYAQVMQELLGAETLLAANRTGLNCLLVRLEDWLRDRRSRGIEENAGHLRRVASDFAAAVEAFQERTNSWTFVFICPSYAFGEDYAGVFEKVQAELAARLGCVGSHVFCWAHSDLMRLYPVAQYQDQVADRAGHIPYTNEYFVAIATFLARKIAALLKPQPKVIAIDCDNTLWQGICGEDGPDGVQITPAHRQLYELLVHQYESGMLLCLCSKNNPADVEAVFRTRQDLLLREEHFVASRINWTSKSQNLQSLAQELDLSLDSFIFVDDNPMECAEVKAGCPSVLTLQFPQTEEQIAHFLAHVWAFDRVGVTKDARKRTQQYRMNKERARALESSGSLEQFLASLELEVEVTAMTPQHLDRVAELIQRTNQFNLTTIRRTSTEIDALCASGEMRCLVVHVKDRFGDYGLVGALLIRRDSSRIKVDTFVLSCRVLGRGVENRLIAELGRMAQHEGVGQLVLEYRPTPRNKPAGTFLEKTFGRFKRAEGAQYQFIVPIEHALVAAIGNSDIDRQPSAESTNPSVTPAALAPADWSWHEAALRLSRIADIADAIRQSAPTQRRGDAGYVAPGSPLEVTLADIWSEVLAQEEISVQADFLELGGDSILAVQVISRIGAVLGLELSIYDFFEGPTIQKLAQKLATASASGPPITAADRRCPLLLSWAQQRLWFLDRLEGGSLAYHIPLAIKLSGPLDPAAFRWALDALVERHEALRTTFIEVDAEPVQTVQSSGTFPLRVVDLRAHPAEGRDAEVMRQSREQLGEAFDLGAGPLIRARLLQLSAEEHVLLVSMHHIISDGWSLGLMIRELGALYEARVHGRSSPLAPLPIQYADYAQWQRLIMADIDEQLDFWKEHLRGAPIVLALPTDRQRPAVHSYRGGTVRVVIDEQLTAGLKQLSRRHNATLAMTLHTALLVLLARLSGQQDIVIGMPIANRRRAELEGLIGFFVNTLAVRIRFEESSSVADLLDHVKKVMLSVHTHQDIPFEKVVEAVRPVRSLSHSPVFQVMFVLHNTPSSVEHVAGLRMTQQETMRYTAQFDLTLELQEVGKVISGGFNYASDLFDAATIHRWAEHFQVLLREMLRDSSRSIDGLSLTPQREQHRIIRQYSSGRLERPDGRLIHEVFEQQAARSADAVALVCEGASVTFAQLNARAERLAQHLRSRGIGPDDLVAILAERSHEVIIGILAVWKAGAAYLPLDPALPAQRLAYMLGDARPRLLLVEPALKESLPDTQVEAVVIDSRTYGTADTAENGRVPPSSSGNSGQLAYVIYTSGSTGRPKGVMIEHSHVINLWQGLELLYGSSGACQRIALNASLSFDASIQQLVQLLSGRTVYIVPKHVRRDATALLDFIETYCIDGIDCTPSQLRSWIATGLLGKTTAHRPRVTLVGGEAIDSELWRRLAGSRQIRFFNVYGPTECTVDATVAGVDADAAVPHIGRPMANRRVYVVDGHLQPVPVGVAGEIYIGGAGVGRGYLNRPQLTAERFLPDPFGVDSGGRMYRTGDLGRFRVDGSIEYLGRVDHQVKIRGHRIELGEIEARLIQHDQVKEAVVLAREVGPEDKRLVAYIRPRHQGQLSAPELRADLAAVLPEHMVPGGFITVDRIPLTPSGKVDRQALNALEMSIPADQRYVPPQGEIEEVLARIWQEVLHVPRVGRHDNFFDVGGHSLLIVKAVSRINEALGCNLRVIDVYGNPTIQQLASRVAGVSGGNELVDLAQEARLDPQFAPIEGSLADGVLLTGATGFVGRFLLVQLLQETDSSIYCLVRANSLSQARSRIRSALARWNLWREEFDRRIVAVAGDLAKPDLGLDARMLQTLGQKVGVIYHCGASMNHLETYAMARAANVESARELLKLATSDRPKLINYVSTLSVFASLPETSLVTEHSPIEQERHSAQSGYVASKWVAERILMTASERGIPCNIFRVGLVWADTREGRYDELQREYRIIKSALLSGYGIKGYRPDMPPTPVDYVARAIAFLGARHHGGKRVFHISSSAHCIDGLFERYNELAGTSLELIPYYDWIRHIKRLHGEGLSLPVLPLVESAAALDERTFYEERRRVQAACARFDFSRTQQELEQANIVAPSLDDAVLVASLNSMFARDEDLRGSVKARAVVR
jgi:amino acid adenylation domain-containing protein/FkbH-like protein/thioester reductase-like protein